MKIYLVVKHPEEELFISCGGNLPFEIIDRPRDKLVEKELTKDLYLRDEYVSNVCFSNKEAIAVEIDWTYFGNLPSANFDHVIDDNELSTKFSWRKREELEEDALVRDIFANVDWQYWQQVKSRKKLLKSIKANMAHLDILLNDISDHWVYEDLVYRFYHGSFKTYRIQSYTRRMVHWFSRIAGGAKMNDQFLNIVKNGTGKRFDYSHNSEWDKHTRPMVEAFFHAKFFLEMMIKYGKELDGDISVMPSGYAALLYLYDMR